MGNTKKELKTLITWSKTASDKIVRTIVRAFGLREEGAMVLRRNITDRIKYNLRLAVLTLILVFGCFYVLVSSVNGVVGRMIQGGDPVPDMENFLEGLSLKRYMSYGLAIVCGVLMLRLVWLWKKYQLNRVFLILPLLGIGLCLSFDIAARISYSSKLKDIYLKGTTLFKEGMYGTCNSYYKKFYPVVKTTFIGDNVLGRMAGCEYWQENYTNAAELYCEVLRLYPESDIKDKCRQSLGWAINKIGECQELELPSYIELYDRLKLKQFGISAFRLVLEETLPHESISLDIYDCLTGSRRRAVRDLLERYPDDRWAARAAFWSGREDLLCTAYRDTDYGLAYLVIEGKRLQEWQRFDEAAEKYREYLENRPSGEEREQVRELLAMCYIGQDSLRDAFAQLVSTAGTPYDISPRIDYRLLARFAYESSIEDMNATFDEFHKIVPIDLASDMAEILAERLDLSGHSGTQELREYAARIAFMSVNKKKEEERIRNVIRKRFTFTPEKSLVHYLNSRIYETKKERRYLHLFDRWYSGQFPLLGEPEEISYTEMLYERANSLISAHLQQITATQEKLAFMTDLIKGLNEPNLVKSQAMLLLRQIRSSSEMLDINSLRLVGRLYRFDDEGLIDGIIQRAVSDCFENGKPLTFVEIERAFSVMDNIPTTAGAEAFSKSFGIKIAGEQAPDIETIFYLSSETERLLRNSNYRSKFDEAIVPLIHSNYSRVCKEEPSEQKRRSLRDLAIYCLRDPNLYALAKTYFEDYIKTFPNDPYVENCQLWLGWLLSFEAYKYRSLPHKYIENYEKALEYYKLIIKHGKQPRVILNARNAVHKIGIKVNKASSGLVRPDQFIIPEEFKIFALPASSEKSLKPFPYEPNEIVINEPYAH